MDCCHAHLVSCCSKGLKVDLGFFDDLLVPEYHFPAEYWFHSQDGLWVWKYEGNDMYLDLKETIRCAYACDPVKPTFNLSHYKSNKA